MEDSIKWFQERIDYLEKKIREKNMFDNMPKVTYFTSYSGKQYSESELQRILSNYEQEEMSDALQEKANAAHDEWANGK